MAYFFGGKVDLERIAVPAHWPSKTCDSCKQSFRAVRLGQTICNCCAPAPPNRPIVPRATEGDDNGADAS